MSTTGEQKVRIDAPASLLRHRAPFLFVDHAELRESDGRMSSWRSFDPAEDLFRGHFPHDPVVPGVVLLEQAAQTANLLLSHRARAPILAYLALVSDAAFALPVHPPETVLVEVRDAEPNGGSGDALAMFRVNGFVNGKRCFRASIGLAPVG